VTKRERAPVAQGLLERDDLSDVELWHRGAAGDERAFGWLFDRHAHRIYNFCLRRVGDPAAAEDLLSTTFLHAWRRRREVRFSGATALPWFYGVASNLARRHLRTAGRRRAALRRLSEPQAEPDPADAVAGRVDEVARLRKVLRAMESLSDRDRELLALCVWEGLSYEEAAIALGVPVGTVRSGLSRTRRRLRALLEKPNLEVEDERGIDDPRPAKEGHS